MFVTPSWVAVFPIISHSSLDKVLALSTIAIDMSLSVSESCSQATRINTPGVGCLRKAVTPFGTELIFERGKYSNSTVACNGG